MSVGPVPEGYHSVIPYLIVDDAAKAIDFYVKAFGAEEVVRMPQGDKVMHAELKIGDAHVMLADEAPEMGYRGPKAVGGSPVSIMIYVPEVDQVVTRAIDAGAIEERPVEDQFYGDRSGTLFDPFGHRWHVATHIEDVPPEEMERRMAAMKQEPEPETT